MNKINSAEFENYIDNSIQAISRGIEKAGLELIDPIEFNLAITNSSETEGGIKIHVVNAENKSSSEEISHIKFKAHPKVEPSAITVHNPYNNTPFT